MLRVSAPMLQHVRKHYLPHLHLQIQAASTCLHLVKRASTLCCGVQMISQVLTAKPWMIFSQCCMEQYF